jgi:putative tryptophan/tyrosine transport system substrate-binding protein
MKKSMVFLALVGLTFASSYPVKAQQPTKVRKIGFLNPTGGPMARFETFREGLRQLGYVEGQNFAVEYRSGERAAQLEELAAELVRQKVDLIVTAGPGVAASMKATQTIPIVFSFSGDPIEAGFVDSLARPGRNMTGVTQLAFELVGKRLELLKEAVPRVSRVAVLANPAHPGEQRELKETQSTARALGIALQYNQVRDTANVDTALQTILKEKATAILVFPDGVTNGHRSKIAEFTIKHQLPSVFGRKEPVEAGGLMSYGPNLDELSKRMLAHVDKVLKGIRPADIPVEQPTKFEFVVNLKTANEIGLTIPPSVLAQADRVIK